MHTKTPILLALFLCALSCSGCAGEDAEDVASEEEPHSVTIWNRGQFSIETIHLHETSFWSPEQHEGMSLIDAPLEPEATLDETITSGTYVTFVRTRPDGEPLAVTTSQPIIVDAEGYTLILFDDSFRLMRPEP